MAKLTAAQRAKLKPQEFGLPEKARTEEQRKESGNYPMPDEGHAISAKSLAKRQHEKGDLSQKDLERIERKADKVLDD
ncbi:MAG TPA: hypothetical protein VNB94_11800 [Mycobacteriales bacterium]|nr:hypothetical protein [Mycobacteriales bacterium]